MQCNMSEFFYCSKLQFLITYWIFARKFSFIITLYIYGSYFHTLLHSFATKYFYVIVHLFLVMFIGCAPVSSCFLIAVMRLDYRLELFQLRHIN